MNNFHFTRIKSAAFSLVYFFALYRIALWFQTNFITDNISILQAVTTYLFGFILPGLILIYSWYILCYYLDHPAIEKFKIDSTPWPWKEDSQKWLKTDGVKYFIQIVKDFAAFVLYYNLSFYITGVSFKTSALPGLRTFVIHLFMLYIGTDFIFYWGHRVLHHPMFYARIHKQHHYTSSPNVFDNIIASWTETYILTYLPLLVPQLLLGSSCHLMTYVVWTHIFNHVGLQEHSGYDFKINPLHALVFIPNVAFHNYHHAFIEGNYSNSSIIWDTIFGTAYDYHKEMALVQKQNLKKEKS